MERLGLWSHLLHVPNQISHAPTKTEFSNTNFNVPYRIMGITKHVKLLDSSAKQFTLLKCVKFLVGNVLTNNIYLHRICKRYQYYQNDCSIWCYIEIGL